MSNEQNFKDFFPVDQSTKTNLHYDLVASKFMTGVESHQRRQHYNSSSTSDAFGLIGGIFQIIIGLIVLIFTGLRIFLNWLSK